MKTLAQIYRSFMHWDIAIVKSGGYSLQQEDGSWKGYNKEGTKIGAYSMATSRGYLNV